MPKCRGESARAVESAVLLAQGARPNRLSLLQYCPILVLTLIVLGNVWQRTDPDLWGHIRFGQEMLSLGRIVARDRYSYTAYGYPWNDYEYLTEIIMAAIYNAAGVRGLKLWKLACVSLTVLFLVEGLAETGAPSLIQLSMLGFAVLASGQFSQFRPQLHSYVLFALTLALLARGNFRRSGLIWLMIPVMFLWSNLHGGFVIGLITLALYATTAAIMALSSQGSAGHHGEVLTIVGFAGTATLLPPHGLIAWRAVLTTLSNPLTYKIFTEWQPLDTAIARQWSFNHCGIVMYLFLIGLWLALTGSVVKCRRGGDLPLIIIAIATGIAALKSVRNMPFAAMACALPAARHLGLMLDPRTRTSRSFGRVPHWAQYALALAALLLTNREILSSQLQTDMAYPSSAVRFMRERGLRGNVLVYFCWAEYVIWHLHDAKVFFDSRYDMVYPAQVTNDYLAFYWDLPGAEKILTRYDHDFVLFPSAEKVCEEMIKMPGWKLIFHDATASLFTRADSAAGQAIDRPVVGPSSQVQFFP